MADPRRVLRDRTNDLQAFRQREKKIQEKKHAVTPKGDGKPKVHKTQGACQIEGSKHGQEDAFARDKAAGASFAKIPDNKKEAACKELFLTLHEKHGHEEDIGATLCCNVAWIKENKLESWTSYVGDSLTYCVIIPNDGSKPSIQRLNTHLHNPKPPPENKDTDAYKQWEINYSAEWERLTHLDQIKISADDVMSGTKLVTDNDLQLSVSRAIGDRAAKFVTCQPEVEHHSIEVKDATCFIVSGSDALGELQDNEEKIQQSILATVLQNKSKSEADIAFSLAHQVRDVSSDDTTIIVRKVTHTPELIAVSDGHNGNKVSNAIAKDMATTLVAISKKDVYQEKISEIKLTIADLPKEADAFLAHQREKIENEIKSNTFLQEILLAQEQLARIELKLQDEPRLSHEQQKLLEDKALQNFINLYAEGKGVVNAGIFGKSSTEKIQIWTKSYDHVAKIKNILTSGEPDSTNIAKQYFESHKREIGESTGILSKLKSKTAKSDFIQHCAEAFGIASQPKESESLRKKS